MITVTGLLAAVGAVILTRIVLVHPRVVKRLDEIELVLNRWAKTNADSWFGGKKNHE